MHVRLGILWSTIVTLWPGAKSPAQHSRSGINSLLQTRSRVLHKDRALLPSRCRGSPLIFTYCAFAQPSCCGHVLVSTSKATFGQLCDRLFWRRRCQAPRLPLPSLFSKARVTKLFHTRAREWLALLPMAHGKTNSARSLLKEKRMAHLQYASANILEICMTVCMSNPVAHMIGNAAENFN